MRFKTFLLMSLIFPLIIFYSLKDSRKGDKVDIMKPEEKNMEMQETAVKDPSGRETRIVGMDSTVSDGRIYKIDNVLRSNNISRETTAQSQK